MSLTAQLLGTCTLTGNLTGITCASSLATPSGSTRYVSIIRDQMVNSSSYLSQPAARSADPWGDAGWTTYYSISSASQTYSAITGALANGGLVGGIWETLSAYWILYKSSPYVLLYTSKLDRSVAYTLITNYGDYSGYTDIWSINAIGPFCFVCTRNPTTNWYLYQIWQWNSSGVSCIYSITSSTPVEHRTLWPGYYVLVGYDYYRNLIVYNGGPYYSFVQCTMNGDYRGEGMTDAFPFTPLANQAAFSGHRGCWIFDTQCYYTIIGNYVLYVFRLPDKTCLHGYNFNFSGINLYRLAFCNSYSYDNDNRVCYILIAEQASTKIRVHAAKTPLGVYGEGAWEEPVIILERDGYWAYFWAEQERPVFIVATTNQYGSCLSYSFYRIVEETPGDPGGPGAGVGKSGSLLYNAVNC